MSKLLKRVGAATVTAGLLTTVYLANRGTDEVKLNLGASDTDGLVRVFSGNTKIDRKYGYVVSGYTEETADPQGAVPVASLERDIMTKMQAIVKRYDELRSQVSLEQFKDERGMLRDGVFEDFIAEVPDAQTLLNDRAQMDNFSRRVAILGGALWYTADPDTQDKELRAYYQTKEGWAEVERFRALADEATGLSARLDNVERLDAIRDFVRGGVKPVAQPAVER